LSVVGEHWHRFPDAPHGQPGGITGMLLLAESHVALHTWPEIASVTLDVYVCNYEGDNSAKARALMGALVALFAPADARQHALVRGRLGTEAL
jgi:spermidine synthase/S-adenosylmethionine decarboxylase